MSVESGAFRKLERNRGHSELDKTSPEQYERARKVSGEFVRRARDLGRIAAVSLVLQGSALQEKTRGMQERDTMITERISHSQILEEQASRGTIQLSSGETTVIPVEGGELERVKVYTPKDTAPDKLILLFGQLHVPNTEGMDISKKMSLEDRILALEETEKNQRIIYDELRKLAEQGVISVVCSESLTDDVNIKNVITDYVWNSELIIAEVVASIIPESDIAQVVTRRNEIYSDSNVTEEEGEELSTHINPQIERNYEKFKHLMDSEFLLAEEKLISSCPASARDSYEAGRKLLIGVDKKTLLQFTPREREQYDKVLLEDREDDTVRLAVSQGNDVMAIKYGLGHDFTDAIERWNIAHPETQLGLVDIRPIYK